MSGYSFVNHRITVIYLHIFLVATSTYKRDLSISVEDFEFGVIVGDPSETKKNHIHYYEKCYYFYLSMQKLLLLVVKEEFSDISVYCAIPTVQAPMHAFLRVVKHNYLH